MFEVVGFAILGLIMVSIAVGHRLLRRPGGIGAVRRKFRQRYVEAVRESSAHRYQWGYLAHQKAMMGEVV